MANLSLSRAICYQEPRSINSTISKQVEALREVFTHLLQSKSTRIGIFDLHHPGLLLLPLLLLLHGAAAGGGPESVGLGDRTVGSLPLDLCAPLEALRPRLPAPRLNHELVLPLHPAAAADLRRPLVLPVGGGRAELQGGDPIGERPEAVVGVRQQPLAAGMDEVGGGGEGGREEGKGKVGIFLEEEAGGGGVEGEGGGGEVEEVVDEVHGVECCGHGRLRRRWKRL